MKIAMSKSMLYRCPACVRTGMPGMLLTKGLRWQLCGPCRGSGRIAVLTELEISRQRLLDVWLSPEQVAKLRG